MKQWSEIIRNVTMLSQLGQWPCPDMSGSMLADCF